MHLLGWKNPLPIWIEVAIIEEKYKVVFEIIQGKEYEMLYGSTINPYGIIIEFK